MKNQNMTQKKWVDILLQKLIARGMRLSLDELPHRYISREFLTARLPTGGRTARNHAPGNVPSEARRGVHYALKRLVPQVQAGVGRPAGICGRGGSPPRMRPATGHGERALRGD